MWQILVINVTGSQTTMHAGSHSIGNETRWHWQSTKCVFVLENSAPLEVVCVISVFCLMNSPAFGKKKKKEQVTDTYHQQPSIYILRLLACHSISHSMDYTPRGAWGENHSGNPILCHIKCQDRSFRFSVISTETAGAKLGEHVVEVEEGGRDEGFSTGERERGWRMSWRYVRKPYWPSGPALYATMGRSYCKLLQTQNRKIHLHKPIAILKCCSMYISRHRYLFLVV